MYFLIFKFSGDVWAFDFFTFQWYFSDKRKKFHVVSLFNISCLLCSTNLNKWNARNAFAKWFVNICFWYWKLFAPKWLATLECRCLLISGCWCFGSLSYLFSYHNLPTFLTIPGFFKWIEVIWILDKNWIQEFKKCRS